MKNLVSIILPAFNAERWIKDSIESAVSQTWHKKEIIIVDDGSNDSTLRIAQYYTKKNTIVISTENHGASSARNVGLSVAQGEYIQWLDSDDVLDVNKIERQMKVAIKDENPRNLYSGAWTKFMRSTHRGIFSPDNLWMELSPIEWMLRKMEQNLWMPPIVFLTNRKLIEAAGPWNETLSLNDDGEYFSRVISHAEKVRFVDEARCYKRSTIGLSHDANLSDLKLDSLWFTLKSSINTIRGIKDNARVRTASLTLLNRWSIYFYPHRQDIFLEMQCMAKDLGGSISTPELPKKYKLIQKAFGWKFAKKVQFNLPIVRHILNKIFRVS